MESTDTVTRDEYLTGMQEQVDNIIEAQKVINSMNQVVERLRHAINTHAEIMGLHRYLLERFIPAPTLAAAVDEYAHLRAAAIEQERLAGLGIKSSTGGN